MQRLIHFISQTFLSACYVGTFWWLFTPRYHAGFLFVLWVTMYVLEKTRVRCWEKVFAMEVEIQKHELFRLELEREDLYSKNLFDKSLEKQRFWDNEMSSPWLGGIFVLIAQASIVLGLLSKDAWIFGDPAKDYWPNEIMHFGLYLAVPLMLAAWFSENIREVAKLQARVDTQIPVSATESFARTQS